MTDKQIINEIDISKCEFCYSGEYCHIYSGTADFKWICKENEDCLIKNLLLQLKRKEQECEELKKELHKNFEEKDTLHLIIDRLLEASGYDTNTASAEDFEDVYEHMRYEQQQLDQLKSENDELKKIIERLDVPKHEVIDMDIALENEKLKQTLTKIKFWARELLKRTGQVVPYEIKQILQKISECEVENGNKQAN